MLIRRFLAKLDALDSSCNIRSTTTFQVVFKRQSAIEIRESIDAGKIQRSPYLISDLLILISETVVLRTKPRETCSSLAHMRRAFVFTSGGLLIGRYKLSTEYLLLFIRI